MTETGSPPRSTNAEEDRAPYRWLGPVDRAELAAFRRCWAAEPGSVPDVWGYYRHLSPDGRVSGKLRAEHCAIALFGLHQQSESVPMHWSGVRLGQALHRLRLDDKFSTDAVDRRVAQCATADDVAEFAQHLRGLISQLKSLSTPQGFDYVRLVADLIRWQSPDGRPRVRRQLGADYFHFDKTPDASRKD